MTDKDTPQMHVCIIGCGDVGQRLAASWQADNVQTSAVVRSTESKRKLVARGLDSWQCDLANPDDQLPVLAPNTLIYYFVPPNNAKTPYL